MRSSSAFSNNAPSEAGSAVEGSNKGATFDDILGDSQKTKKKKSRFF
jgi:hypothetical protein